MIEPDEAERRFRRSLRELIELMPADYDRRSSGLRSLRHAFHDEIAVALAPAFNASLRERDQESLDSRRDLAVWAGEQLRALGLGVRCPRTHRPAHLTVDLRDRDDDKGRFRLEYRDESGRLVRTLSSAWLPEFVLVEQAPRLEVFARSFRANRDPRAR